MVDRRIPLTPRDAVSSPSTKRGRVESGGRIAEAVDAKDGVGAATLKTGAKAKAADYPDRQMKGYKTR